MSDLASLKEDKLRQEQLAVENALSVLHERLPWYKPWRLFSHLREVKRVTIVLATITSSCLSEVIRLQQNQLDMVNIQEAFQKQINLLEGRGTDE